MSTPNDFGKVREFLRRAMAGSGVFQLQERRINQWCQWLRSAAAGERLEAAQERALHLALCADLVDPGGHALTPLLWRELEAELALEQLIERMEAACEVFDVDGQRLLAFVIPFAVRIASQTPKNWRVPLTDQERRMPVALAIQKRTGAEHVVLDPHIYSGPALSRVPPLQVRDHLRALMKYTLGSPVLPTPLVEPVQLRATQVPAIEVVYSIGVAAHRPEQALMIRDRHRVRQMNDLLFVSELSFPLRFERLLAFKVVHEVKCQGIKGWHAGLRLGGAAARRYALGQQQWTGDSSRYVPRVDGGLSLG